MSEKEILQKEVVESMLMYGGSDERTVELSQRLDIIIVTEQRVSMGLNKYRC